MSGPPFPLLGVLTAREGDADRAGEALPWLRWLAVPAWILDRSGSLSPDPPAVRAAALVRAAASAGVALLAVVDAAGDALAEALGDPAARARASDAVAAALRASLPAAAPAPPAGVLLCPRGDLGAQGDELAAWVEELSWRARRAGAALAVAVEPQVREPRPGEPGYGYDYRVLGVYADLLLLRGFGYRGDAAPPHPTAPEGWLRSLLEHALSLVPQRAAVLCLPLFGLLWDPGEPRGRRLPAREAAALAGERRVDPATGSVELHASGGEGGPAVAWVDDAETLAAKAALAAEYGVGGVGFWGVGWEPAGLWPRVAARLGGRA